MKRLLIVGMCSLGLPLFASGAGPKAAKAAGGAPAALKTFMEREGFGGSPLQRRFGNHLFATTMINGKRTALLVDTGCPYTLINRDSANKLGLHVTETKSYVVGVGGTAARCGASSLGRLAMGNCTFVNVPVQVADENQINLIARPHMDGLFGAHEMAKFGAVIDCARQMLYVDPNGHSAAASEKLAQFLTSRGFSRIPMRLNAEHHPEIDAGVSGHRVPMIVDTGAAVTLLASSTASVAGAKMSPLFAYHGQGVGNVAQLGLGNLVVNNAEVAVGNVPKFVKGGLLGEEYLTWNFAVIDFGGMNLYLRPPDRN
jgi:predicted aspartyl protease